MAIRTFKPCIYLCKYVFFLQVFTKCDLFRIKDKNSDNRKYFSSYIQSNLQLVQHFQSPPKMMAFLLQMPYFSLKNTFPFKTLVHRTNNTNKDKILKLIFYYNNFTWLTVWRKQKMPAEGTTFSVMLADQWSYGKWKASAKSFWKAN